MIHIIHLHRKFTWSQEWHNLKNSLDTQSFGWSPLFGTIILNPQRQTAVIILKHKLADLFRLLLKI